MDERTVRMVNPVRRLQVMHFYEGQLTVDDKGVVHVPADKRHWVLRLWRLGFNKTLDGKLCCTHPDKHIAHELAGEPAEHQHTPEVAEGEQIAVTFCAECGEVLDTNEVEVTPVEETETAESGEGTNDEDSIDGGQPAGPDGVRSSEPTRRRGIPEGGDDSRVGGEPAVGGDSD